MAHILVADADVNICGIIVDLLKRLGHTCDEARDGHEALERIARRLPDLVISDVVMPRMDGWKLLGALRSNPKTSSVPLIFLTARTNPEDRVKGLQLGAEDYINRPFNTRELELRVQKALTRSPQIPSLSGLMRAAGVEFNGALENMGLPALFQVIDLESKSGILELRKENLRARLVFEKGRLRRALMEGRETRSGTDCALAVLRWTSGKFTFVTSPLPVLAEMDVTVSWLLVEAARQRDESQVSPGPETGSRT